MKNIKPYDRFLEGYKINEEEGLKDWTLGAALAASTIIPSQKAIAGDSNAGYYTKNKTEIVQDFGKEKDTVSTEYRNFAKSGVKALKTSVQSCLGRMLGYYVKFQNDSGKEVDGIKWTATFTNDDGEVLGTRTGSWQSGNFIEPLKPGGTIDDLESVFVKGATQIWIKVTEVHFKK